MAIDIRVGQEGRWELLSPFNNILKTDIESIVAYHAIKNFLIKLNGVIFQLVKNYRKNLSENLLVK